MVSYSGWYNHSIVFNYTPADAYHFGFNSLNVTTNFVGNGTTIPSVQVKLKKFGTPPSDVTIELLNSAGTAITGASGTISQTGITTSYATYTATL